MTDDESSNAQLAKEAVVVIPVASDKKRSSVSKQDLSSPSRLHLLNIPARDEFKNSSEPPSPGTPNMKLSRLASESDSSILELMEEQIRIVQTDAPQWMGNIVERVHRALGNPSESKAKELFDPSAREVFQNVVAALQSKTELSPEVLSLNKALECAIKFLVLCNMVAATTVLNVALKIYPNDIRLHKLVAYISLRDRTLNWRSVRLEATLIQLDTVREPDAEVWALRGDIRRELWWLERDRSGVSAQAMRCYVKSFNMCKMSPSLHFESVGYGIARAALLASELHRVESRISKCSEMTKTYSRKATEFLKELCDTLYELSRDDATVRNDRYFFSLAFANFGLGKQVEADEACAKLSQFLRHERMPDMFMENLMHDDLRSMVKIILFSGHKIPESDDRAEWSKPWITLANTFNVGLCGVELTRDILSSFARGRVGLSLSGGGLRASFLHLGMIARLAECDIIRSISSISCVSGGSLVGAHMYLHMKDLIESKPDREIVKQDGIDLAHRLIDEFSAGISEDLYTETLLNPLTNLRVWFLGNPLRGQLLAENYRKHLYSYYGGKKDWSRVVRMVDLPMTPHGWERSQKFEPRVHNWRRSTKIPAIYLNCTTLNTGHMWRFTATYMGERADMSGADFGVDSNALLESIRYDDAQLDEHRNFRLCDAVVISSLVPGFFVPWTIRGLYPGWDVQLVDGGVYDNAGLQSLYHSRTDIIITNEMGVNMKDLQDRTLGPINVLSRVLDISLDLTYERVFRELRDKCRQHGVTDVCFINLRQPDMLPPHERMNYHRFIPALSRMDPDRAKRLSLRHRSIRTKGRRTPRKMMDEIRDEMPRVNPRIHMGLVLHSQIAHTRSSLDGFTEVERHALMATGYQMASVALEKSRASRGRWTDRSVFPNIDLSEFERVGRVSLEDGDMKERHVVDWCHNDDEWAFFNVDAPRRDWVFTPVWEIMEEAKKDEIIVDRDKGEHNKQIHELSCSLVVEKVTKNPAVRELYHQLKRSKLQFAFQRAFDTSKLMYVFFMLLFAAAAVSFAFWSVSRIVDFGKNGRANGCFCVFEEPLFWSVFALSIVVLFLRPGYLTMAIWEAVVLPIYAVFSLYVFDTYLYWVGRTDRLIRIRQEYDKKISKRAKRDKA